MHVCMYVCRSEGFACDVGAEVYMHVCMYGWIELIYIYIYIYIYIHTHTHQNTYKYTYEHTYMHTYIHTGNCTDTHSSAICFESVLLRDWHEGNAY
jgi:hypothetical protein